MAQKIMTCKSQWVEDSPKHAVTAICFVCLAIDIPIAPIKTLQDADKLLGIHFFVAVTIISTNQIDAPTNGDNPVQHILTAAPFKQHHIISSGGCAQFFNENLLRPLP